MEILWNVGYNKGRIQDVRAKEAREAIARGEATDPNAEVMKEIVIVAEVPADAKALTVDLPRPKAKRA